jgi:hypothetical protein
MPTFFTGTSCAWLDSAAILAGDGGEGKLSIGRLRLSAKKCFPLAGERGA